MSKSNFSSFRELHNKHRFEELPMLFAPLWHYTSGNGLMGIVRDDPSEYGKLHFWFTRSDCLNDSSEGSHILDLYRNVCKVLFEEEKISSTFLRL